MPTRKPPQKNINKEQPMPTEQQEHDEDAGLLGSAVKFSHLFIATISVAVGIGTVVLANERRLTTVETQFASAVMYAKIRNDNQDAQILAQQNAVTGVQVAVAQLSSKLDGIASQLAILNQAVITGEDRRTREQEQQRRR